MQSKIIIYTIKNISKYYELLLNTYINNLKHKFEIIILNLDIELKTENFSNIENYKKLMIELDNIFFINKNKYLDDIFIYTPILYAYILLVCNWWNLYSKYAESHNLINMYDSIINNILMVKYVNIWGELFTNEQLKICGYEIINTELTINYFKNSIINLISVYSNIKIIEYHNIYNNIYFPLLQYSNNTIFKNIKNKTIDILIFCDINNILNYRNEQIEKIKDKLKMYNIKIIQNIYNDELNEYLNNSKIVLHIPSYSNLQHMAWAKIINLILNKHFFIIETNNELYIQQKIDHDICYNPNLDNLNEIIEKYINNDILKNKIIEKHFNIFNDIKIDCIFDFINQKKTYVFLLDENVYYTSHIFYNNMLKKIINIFKLYKINYIIEYTFSNYVNYRDDKYVLMLDCSLISKYNNFLNFDWINNYIFIIGENYDKNIDSFYGWDTLDYTFEKKINKIIKNALHVTYQNDKIKNIINKLNNNNSFFCIDGYINELKITPKQNKNIDILYYAEIFAYERRCNFLYLLLNTKYKITIIESCFNIDELINNSKINIHCNSVNNCYHIPYAKISKLLLKYNLVYCEEAEEIINNNIKDFLILFKYPSIDNKDINLNSNEIIKQLNFIFNTENINKLLNIDDKNKEYDIIINSSSTYFMFIIIIYLKHYFLCKSIIISNHFEIDNCYYEKSKIVINIIENDDQYILYTNQNILNTNIINKSLFSSLFNVYNNNILNDIENTIRDFDKHQEQLIIKNSFEFIKKNYNFKNNVLDIVKYPKSPLI
jgi:hypothetical protein